MRVLLGVVLLCGFGAVLASAQAGRSAARDVPLQPAPPIVAVDEAPPDDMAEDWSPDSFAGADQSLPEQTCATGDQSCLGSDTVEVGGASGWQSFPPSGAPTPSPEVLAKVQAELKQAEDAVRPVAPPRVVAKLDLGNGAYEVLAAWRNAAGEVCTDTEEVDGDGPTSSNGPSGPCGMAAYGAACTSLCADMLPACTDQLCLDSNDDGLDDTSRYVLTGVVDASATELRVTDEGGTTRAYPLRGPIVADSDSRVFMLDLGAQDWRSLELVRAGRDVATAQMPKFQARVEECERQIVPTLSSGDGGADLQAQGNAWAKEFGDCLRAGGIDFPALDSGAPGAEYQVLTISQTP